MCLLTLQCLARQPPPFSHLEGGGLGVCGAGALGRWLGCVLSQSGGRASGAGFVWSSVSGAWILWLGVSAVGTCGWGICVAGTPESFLSAHCVLELAVSRAPAQYTAGPSTSAHRCAFLPKRRGFCWTPDDGVGIPVYFAGQGLPTPSLVPIVTIKVCQKQPLGRLGVISGRVWWARHRVSQVKCIQCRWAALSCPGQGWAGGEGDSL